MKKSVILIAAAVMAIGQIGAQALKADARASKVTWKASKVTGSHNGTLALKSGDITMEGNNLKTGRIVLDMTNIVILDITDQGTNGKLLGHLKSDDFFSVAKNPTATFEVTKAVASREADGANTMITGKLSIKGITNEITFPASVTYVNGQLRAKANLKFDRTKFDVKYGSGSFFDGLGDSMIYDDVEVGFDLVTKVG